MALTFPLSVSAIARRMGAVRHALVISLLFLAPVVSTGQSAPYRHGGWNEVAHYTSRHRDQTGAMLKSVGYRVPKQYRDKWGRMPAARKVDMAYRAAERRHQGAKMLRKMDKMMNDRFESFRYDRDFEPMRKAKVRGGKKVRYAKDVNDLAPDTVITPTVRRAILAVTRYTDRGLLGGPQTVLSDYGQLPTDSVYEILTTANSDQEALLNGAQLYAANTGPVFERVVHDLDRCAPSVGMHPEVKPLCSGYKRTRFAPGQKIENTDRQLVTVAAWRYKHYLGREISPKAFAFDSMIRNEHKWGGVIIGNKFRTDSTLPKPPVHVLWLPDEKRAEYPATGSLEFHFADNRRLVMTGIFLEDVYAAHKILFDVNDSLIPHIRKGYGVGLINAEGDETHKIDIHPAIANLDLGRCAARADVWLRAEEDIRPLLAINNTLSHSDSVTIDSMVYVGKHSGWKFYASPLVISSALGFIDAFNADTTYSNYALSFWHMLSGERRYSNLNAAVPLLCNSLNDFARLNAFTKVFTILRWAQEGDAKFLNRPDEPQMYAPPHTIHVAGGRLITK